MSKNFEHDFILFWPKFGFYAFVKKYMVEWQTEQCRPRSDCSLDQSAVFALLAYVILVYRILGHLPYLEIR